MTPVNLLIWSIFPKLLILGPGSMAAAECAAQQGKFWEYAESLYENQRTSATPDSLIALAEESGLDTDAFEGCLADFPERDSLESQIGVAHMLGVRGTPAFLINGVPLSGALPFKAPPKCLAPGASSYLETLKGQNTYANHRVDE